MKDKKTNVIVAGGYRVDVYESRMHSKSSSDVTMVTVYLQILMMRRLIDYHLLNQIIYP